MSEDNKLTAINLGPSNIHNISDKYYHDLKVLGLHRIIRWARYTQFYAVIFIFSTLAMLIGSLVIFFAEARIETFDQGIQLISDVFIFMMVMICIFIGIGLVWIIFASMARNNGIDMIRTKKLSAGYEVPVSYLIFKAFVVVFEIIVVIYFALNLQQLASIWSVIEFENSLALVNNSSVWAFGADLFELIAAGVLYAWVNAHQPKSLLSKMTGLLFIADLISMGVEISQFLNISYIGLIGILTFVLYCKGLFNFQDSLIEFYRSNATIIQDSPEKQEESINLNTE